MPYKTFWVAVFASSLLARAYKAPNPYHFCVRYFGGLSADLDKPDSIPEWNFDHSIRCPQSWDFSVSGAVLELCPALDPAYPWPSGIDIKAVDPRIFFETDDAAIRRMRIFDLIITNGSVSGPFATDAVPAVLAPATYRTGSSAPVWTVNGTARALESDLEAFFECSQLDPADSRGCGVGNDVHDGGCWADQSFVWNNRSALNFTVEFSNTQASVDIWAESPPIPRNKTRTGSFTSVHIRFSGRRDLPSVVDYDFWEHSTTKYETEQQRLNDIKLQADPAGMPVFMNMTPSGEWYAAKNITYSGGDRIAVRGWEMWMVAVGAVMVWLYVS